MYQSSSACECMSAESPVTRAAAMGAPVSGERRASATASTIAAVTWTVIMSWGRTTPAQRAWSWPASGSRRAGDCGSMMWMSEK